MGDAWGEPGAGVPPATGEPGTHVGAIGGVGITGIGVDVDGIDVAVGGGVAVFDGRAVAVSVG
jgi:hypothetical protein